MIRREEKLFAGAAVRAPGAAPAPAPAGMRLLLPLPPG